MGNVSGVSVSAGLRFLPEERVEPAALKRSGVSSFQRVWEQVYDKTAQVNRQSTVGSVSVSGTGQARPTASVGHETGDSVAAYAAESSGVAQRVDAASGSLRGLETDGTVGLDASKMGGLQASVVPLTSAVPSFGEVVISTQKGFSTREPSLMALGKSPSALWEAGLTEGPNRAPSMDLQAADRASIFRNMLDQIKSLNPKEGETVVLQLPPGELGPLRMEISVEQQNVRADIVTPDAAAKDWLEVNQAVLRQALASQGFGVERFSVSVGDPGHDFERAARREAVAFLADPGLSHGKVGRFSPRAPESVMSQPVKLYG